MYVHDDPSSPRLSGQHFRFTIAEASGFVDFENDGSTGFAFSSYAIDILEIIAKPDLADFSLCTTILLRAAAVGFVPLPGKR